VGRMVKWWDCVYAGYDEAAGAYHVHEQLYPEARGFIVHEFKSEQDAKAWLEELKAPSP
jgi:hypothetical protein